MFTQIICTIKTLMLKLYKFAFIYNSYALHLQFALIKLWYLNKNYTLLKHLMTILL